MLQLPQELIKRTILQYISDLHFKNALKLILSILGFYSDLFTAQDSTSPPGYSIDATQW